MTVEEGIKGLRNLFSEYELDLPDTDSLEILHMATNALEKRISIKPQKVLAFTGKTVFECMNCGNELEVNVFNGQYCHWCGQKLDWSDVD